LVGFTLNLAFGRKLGDPLAGWLGTLAAVGAFVATVIVYFSLLGRNEFHRSVDKNIYTWFPVGGLHVNFGLQLDQLSIFFALFVTGVGSLIHLYSIGYMKGDGAYPRFFVYLNLFLLSMLVLVLADNFLFTFLGWEGVGFCSYGLVGFWFERNSAAVAAKKAFVTNRVGDFGFLLAIFFMFNHFGSLNFTQVLGGYHNGHAFGLLAGQPGAISGSTATAISMLLLLGAAGKSAQGPLYMWLPDAMEGPTPVSALIHAATMVTAGVYLLCRAAPLLHYGHAAQWAIAIVGAFTALFAATIACAQDDIKRVLAYSTLSQLGYMFLAVGAGAETDGLFHTLTHAFFKALLFLAAGSVIHGMHDEQNMKKMGALRRYMPVTSITFLIGWLAISGIPPFSGFWSKDDILDSAWHMNKGLWAVGALTAGLTAYYMSRQVRLVFFGQARWKENAVSAGGRGSPGSTPPAPDGGGPVASTEAGDSSESHGAVVGHGTSDHGGADSHGGGDPHESPWVMRLPLVILGFLAAFGGIINLPFKPFNALDRWLGPIFPASIVPPIHVDTSTKVVLAVVVTAICALGLVAGLLAWGTADHPALEPAVLSHGWYVDEALAATVSGPIEGMADGLAYEVDAKGIDGLVNGVATLSTRSGQILRRLQTGYVRNYALGIGLGTVVILFFVALRVGS
jgi:NADH-quinone oxidoreductase subunit L